MDVGSGWGKMDKGRGFAVGFEGGAGQDPACSPMGKPSQGSWAGCSSALFVPWKNFIPPVRVNQSFPFPHLLFQLPKSFATFPCHSWSVLSMFSFPKSLVRDRHIQGLQGQSPTLTRFGFLLSLWRFFPSLWEFSPFPWQFSPSLWEFCPSLLG